MAHASPGVFRVGHVFQRGDLPLLVTDFKGNLFSPYSVRYTLLYMPKDSQCLVRAGACGRTPVMADVGEYYATGCAGECGQPGQWYVRWVLQEYFDGPLTTQEFGFVVFDTATYCVGSCSSGSTSGTSSGRSAWNCGCNGNGR